MSEWYLFWLGVAVGLAVLAMTAYRAVSPRWLTWTLWGCGLLMIGRYLTMAIFATNPEPRMVGLLQRLWFGSAVGLTFPGVVALDQLVRHPAMTPKKLLQRFAPFLVVAAIAIGLGRVEAVPDPVIGLRLTLSGWAVGLLVCAQTVFVVLMVGLALMLAKKLPSRPIRLALAGLAAAYASLGLGGVLGSGLYAELLVLAAIWFALETARRHPL